MSQKRVSWNSPEIYGEKVLMSAPAKLPLSILLIVINQGSLLTDMSCRSVRFLSNDLKWSGEQLLTHSNDKVIKNATHTRARSALFMTVSSNCWESLGPRKPSIWWVFDEWMKEQTQNQYGTLRAGLISATNCHMLMSTKSTSLALVLLLIKWECWAWWFAMLLLALSLLALFTFKSYLKGCAP